jgi:hypothetical protein
MEEYKIVMDPGHFYSESNTENIIKEGPIGSQFAQF